MNVAQNEAQYEEIYPDLRFACKSFKDYQEEKKGTSNRLRAALMFNTDCIKGEAKSMIKSIFTEESVTPLPYKRGEYVITKKKDGTEKKKLVPVDDILPVIMQERLRETYSLLYQTTKSAKKLESMYERAMVKLVKTLPIWEEFGLPLPGLGPGMLGQILFTANYSLSDYRNPASLWSRFGVGLFEDPKTGKWLPQRKYRDKDLALKANFSPRRRSVIWNAGQCLIKNNKDGYYKNLYDEYKLRKREEHECIDPEDDEKGCCQCDARAQRYMVKRLLLNLWKFWNQGH
jgi:hypothetical protein